MGPFMQRPSHFVLVIVLLLTALVHASDKVTEQSHLSSVAGENRQSPVENCQDEIVSMCDHLVYVGRRRPVFMSGAEIETRKVGAEMALELASIILVGTTLLSEWCEPTKLDTITALLALMMLAKMGKCALTTHRTFPSLFTDFGSVCASDLKGLVRKLGLGDMLLTALVLVGSGMTIGLHYPYCDAGSLAEDSKMALAALLIMNVLQLGLTSASLGTWCCANM